MTVGSEKNAYEVEWKCFLARRRNLKSWKRQPTKKRGNFEPEQLESKIRNKSHKKRGTWIEVVEDRLACLKNNLVDSSLKIRINSSANTGEETEMMKLLPLLSSMSSVPYPCPFVFSYLRRNGVWGWVYNLIEKENLPNFIWKDLRIAVAGG